MVSLYSKSICSYLQILVNGGKHLSNEASHYKFILKITILKRKLCLDPLTPAQKQCHDWWTESRLTQTPTNERCSTYAEIEDWIFATCTDIMLMQYNYSKRKIRGTTNIPALLVVIVDDVEVKIHVSSSFILIRRDLRLFVTLEPGVVFFMITPWLFFQLPSCQVLLVSPLWSAPHDKWN